MTERTDSLLAELIELQRRTIANQERALEQQAQALAVQQAAVTRQRGALRVVWLLLFIAVLALILPLAWRWAIYLSMR